MQEKRQQLLTEIRTLCEAPGNRSLVEFLGAFYTPDSGQISIALEYMDGGSLADILRVRKRIPEPILSSMFQKLLQVTTLFPVILFSKSPLYCRKRLACNYFSLFMILFLPGIELLAWYSTLGSQRYQASKLACQHQRRGEDY